MDDNQLTRANQLKVLIAKTEKGIDGLKKLQAKRRTELEYPKDDGQYNLNIGEYNDGSGCNAELCRYEGNAELLDVIISTLENQLGGFIKEFAEL